MSWKDALIRSIKDQSSILFRDNYFTIIRDLYPKSRHHFLGIVNNHLLNTLEDLNSSHVDLIDHVYRESVNWTLNFDTKYGFKFGFHIEPSMNRLHLHIISLDHDSIFLKNRKHYNSLNTKFFRSPQDVLNDLKINGKVQLPSKEEMKKILSSTNIVCIFCPRTFDGKNSMSELKRHLKTHYNEIDGTI